MPDIASTTPSPGPRRRGIFRTIISGPEPIPAPPMPSYSDRLTEVTQRPPVTKVPTGTVHSELIRLDEDLPEFLAIAFTDNNDPAASEVVVPSKFTPLLEALAEAEYMVAQEKASMEADVATVSEVAFINQDLSERAQEVLHGIAGDLRIDLAKLYDLDDTSTDLADLVLIDPTDTDEVARLVRYFQRADNSLDVVAAMQTALRAFNRPRIAEPQLTGALVEDNYGWVWVRQSDGLWRNVSVTDMEGQVTSWDSKTFTIDAVRVLYPGAV